MKTASTVAGVLSMATLALAIPQCAITCFQKVITEHPPLDCTEPDMYHCFCKRTDLQNYFYECSTGGGCPDAASGQEAIQFGVDLCSELGLPINVPGSTSVSFTPHEQSEQIVKTNTWGTQQAPPTSTAPPTSEPTQQSTTAPNPTTTAQSSPQSSAASSSAGSSSQASSQSSAPSSSASSASQTASSGSAKPTTATTTATVCTKCSGSGAASGTGSVPTKATSSSPAVVTSQANAVSNAAGGMMAAAGAVAAVFQML